MSNLLKSNTILLRALEPEDLEFLYNCENNPEIWHISNTLSPYSKYILRQYIENSHQDIYTSKQLRLIIATIENKDTPIGAIDLFDFDPYHMRAGVGILIHNTIHREKGYAFESLQLLINYCFEHLKMHQLYCNIASNNQKSLKLFEKAGFKISGTKQEWLKIQDEWENEYILQLINKPAK